MIDNDMRVPVADLHTPDELLATAVCLLSSGDPHVRRAVVLEAITALEAFVHRTVFSILNRTIDPLLVKWLDEKTRMDFDSRLSVLIPVALGQPVDKSSHLWAEYKKAKEIRNKVTHSGKRVSSDEAQFVLGTVHKWLAYLGSTAEVSLALYELKKFVESAKRPIPNEAAAVNIVRDYFIRTQAAITAQEQDLGRHQRADLVLAFGANRVVIEVKMVRGGRYNVLARIGIAIQQVAGYVQQAQFTRGVLVIFSTVEPPEPYSTVHTVENGLVSVVVIKVHS
ncbi:MAG: hypothetical protein NT106_00545 [Candidatus Sumerlaeota bacterium]|nr:hypothetical protein [Candidatus Sumerlaeota bacterium]